MNTPKVQVVIDKADYDEMVRRLEEIDKGIPEMAMFAIDSIASQLEKRGSDTSPVRMVEFLRNRREQLKQSVVEYFHLETPNNSHRG